MRLTKDSLPSSESKLTKIIKFVSGGKLRNINVENTVYLFSWLITIIICCFIAFYLLVFMENKLGCDSIFFRTSSICKLISSGKNSVAYNENYIKNTIKQIIPFAVSFCFN